jgi:hypothetical protein
MDVTHVKHTVSENKQVSVSESLTEDEIIGQMKYAA